MLKPPIWPLVAVMTPFTRAPSASTRKTSVLPLNREK